MSPSLILTAVVMLKPGAEYTILAFDYGEARIGVASGNSLLQIAHPLVTLSNCHSLKAKLEAIQPLIDKWQPQLVVVGAPSLADNPRKIQLLNTIQNFAQQLKRQFGVAVELVNEDYSSSYASSQLDEQGIYGFKQKKMLDQLAACNILASYFSDFMK